MINDLHAVKLFAVLAHKSHREKMAIKGGTVNEMTGTDGAIHNNLLYAQTPRAPT